jgi:hypothetical protein
MGPQKLRAPNHPWQVVYPAADWGYAHDRHAATIRALAVAVHEEISVDQLESLDLAARRWSQVLMQWLEMYAGGPATYMGHGPTVDTGDNRTGELVSREYRRGDIYEPQPVTQWDWGSAIARANEGEEPPPAVALMAAARTALLTGLFRAAVVDAATAAEIALSAALWERLSTDASPEIARALLDATRTFGARIDLATKVGIDVPPKIRDELLPARNRAVHAGTTPTALSAHRAVDAAGALVAIHVTLAREDPDWSDFDIAVIPPDDK